MKTSFVVSTLVIAAIICAATSPVATAQTAMRPVDSNGVFTVSVPDGWTVRQLPMDPSWQTALDHDAGTNRVRAVLAAASPGADPQALVMIFVFDLPRPVSAVDWWLMAGTGFQANFADYRVVKEGIDKLGDHEVYINHFTWQAETDSVMYGVTIMFSEGTTGLLFMAVTPNDPDHIQQYVPVFLQIAETLHASP